MLSVPQEAFLFVEVAADKANQHGACSLLIGPAGAGRIAAAFTMTVTDVIFQTPLFTRIWRARSTSTVL